MVLWAAGLSAIPESCYEAAQVDGASSWQIFFRITLPNLKGTGYIIVVLLAMTLLCLFVSEQDTRQHTLQNFHNSMNTLTAYLSSQDTMSSQWLRLVEGAGNVALSISDNGKPLFSMRHGQEDLSSQFQQVRSRARKTDTRIS